MIFSYGMYNIGTLIVYARAMGPAPGRSHNLSKYANEVHAGSGGYFIRCYKDEKNCRPFKTGWTLPEAGGSNTANPYSAVTVMTMTEILSLPPAALAISTSFPASAWSDSACSI